MGNLTAFSTDEEFKALCEQAFGVLKQAATDDHIREGLRRLIEKKRDEERGKPGPHKETQPA